MENKKLVLSVMIFGLGIFLCFGCTRLSPVDSKRKVHYERGIKYLQYEDYPSAAGEFEKAVNISPRDARARYELAMVYLKLQKTRKAAYELANVVSLQPDHFDATLKLAEMLYQARRTSESLILINKILARHPNYPDALALLARIRLDEGNIDDAMKCIEKAMTLKPDHARYHVIRAMTYCAQNNIENEERALARAVFLEPDRQDYHENLANFYLRQNQTERAIDYLYAVVETHPKWSRMYIKLSGLLEERAAFDKAALALEKLTRIEPENYTTHLLLGNFYRRQGKDVKAQAAYRTAYRRAMSKEGVLEVKRALADLYLDQKALQKAAKLIDEILIESPSDTMGRALKKRLISEKAGRSKDS